MTIPSEAELRAEANKDATVSAYRVSVLYGDFGKRKTTTAVRMVQNRGLLLSSDDSWKVLLNERHSELFKKVDVIRIDGVSQIDYIDFDKGYDTIIWDTISRSVDGYLDILYDAAEWKNKTTGQNAYREQLETDHPKLKGVEVLAPMDYRVTRDIFRPALSRLFELPYHIIFTSQHKEPIKGLSKEMIIRPDVPAATFKIIAERADIIANIRPENRRFVVDMTEQSMSYLGKSRIEGLEGKMDSDAFVNRYKEIVFK